MSRKVGHICSDSQFYWLGMLVVQRVQGVEKGIANVSVINCTCASLQQTPVKF